MSSALDFIAGKDQWTLQEDMLDVADDNLDKREGSVIYDAIAPVAQAVGEFLGIDVLRIYSAINMLEAGGEDLDNWAASYGLERFGAQYAYYNIKIEPEGQDLAVGEMLTSNATNERWVYEGNSVVSSAEPGDYIESVGNHLEPDLGNRDISSITILSVRDSGRDVESDEDLRSRIIRQLRASSGGTVSQYVNWMLNESMGGKGVWGCFIFPRGRRCGYIDIYPINESYDVNKTRWFDEATLAALKEEADPVDSEGWGYGIVPIGQRLRFHAGLFYDMKFIIYVVFSDYTQNMAVPDALHRRIFEVTKDYLNKVINKAVYHGANIPERRGNRYRMLYISSEHAAALDAIKNEPEFSSLGVLGFQITYKRPESDSKWQPQSDDFVSVTAHLTNHRRTVRIFRLDPTFAVTNETYGVSTVAIPRSEDQKEIDW